MEEKHFSLSCPVPKTDTEQIQMAHGGGGTRMAQLIDRVFRKHFSNEALNQLNDSSVLQLPASKIAFTTDSFVVNPLFFPGGNIGTLAINGTVNDLSMSGARPLYLSCGFILEEGMSISLLEQIVEAMANEAAKSGVQIVTGDTKVIDRKSGDGVYINTAGVGVIEHDQSIGPQFVKPGDAVLVNGDLGRHGIAVMAVREGLEFEGGIESDCAPLAVLVQDLIDADIEIHCMRDLTRGGLVSALNEIADSSQMSITLDEKAIPISEEVEGACEMLGLDPLMVANEGRFVLFVPESDAGKALEIMRKYEQGQGAVRIGQVGESGKNIVTLKNRFGTTRILDRLSGEQLPRIC